jgi:hypothetical protein
MGLRRRLFRPLPQVDAGGNAVSTCPNGPLSGRVGERPDPVEGGGLTLARAKTANLNRCDLESLRGVGLAGIDTATEAEVVTHSVTTGLSWTTRRVARLVQVSAATLVIYGCASRWA